MYRKARQWIAGRLASFLVTKPFARNQLVQSIRNRYFKELDIVFPCSNLLSAPLCFSDSRSSYYEVFVNRDYEFVCSFETLPKRWLDIGSNNGFASLYLASLHQSAEQGDLQALLLDADPRSSVCLAEIKRLNPSLKGLEFQLGAVGPAGKMVSFIDAEDMFARVSEQGATSSTREVPVISAAQIAEILPPPYDLIKVDIEGSEIGLLKNYGSLLERTDKLIIEWHSWNAESVGRQAFESLLQTIGFATCKEAKPSQNVIFEGKSGECVVYLCER